MQLHPRFARLIPNPFRTYKDAAADKGRGAAGSAEAGGAGAAQTGGEGPRTVFVEHVTPRRRAQWLFPHPDNPPKRASASARAARLEGRA